MAEENANKNSIPVLPALDNNETNELQSRPLMLEDLKFETLIVSNLKIYIKFKPNFNFQN